LCLQQRALEKEHILQELAAVEVDEAQENRLRAEMQAAINKRRDMRVAMCQQLKERAKQLHEEQQHEMEFRRAVIYQNYSSFLLCRLSKFTKQYLLYQTHSSALSITLSRCSFNPSMKL